MKGWLPHLGRQCVGGAVIAAFILVAQPLSAGFVPYQDGLLGHLQHYQVKKNESLIEIARKHDVGFNEITAANPGLDPFVTDAGTVVTIPAAWILPSLPARSSVVINLPEFRLYYFPKRSAGRTLTFPLGIGDQGTDTPLGSYRIVQKIVKPAWHVPKSIRRQRPSLPEVMPSGPDNPMGSHALRLSSNDILIHGTNRPWGIGRRSSHGCLRLYPEDIVTLFKVLPVGTRVVIVDQPVKIGVSGKRIYLEAHGSHRVAVTVGDVVLKLAGAKLLGRTDLRRLITAMEERRGIPVDITLDLLNYRPPAPARKADAVQGEAGAGRVRSRGAP